MTFDEHEWDGLSNYRDSLEHYGVPGMKWGVRKEREAKGRRRASAKTKARVQNRMSYLERRKREKAKRAAESKAKAEAKKAEREAKKRQDILNSPTRLYKNRRNYSQDEINAALKQFEWERKLNEYSKAEMRAGKEFIDNMFQYTNSAINLYNTSARIVNSFNLSEKPWKYVEQVKTESKKDEGGKKNK